jgi:hypothetical protein
VSLLNQAAANPDWVWLTGLMRLVGPDIGWRSPRPPVWTDR